MSDKTIPLDVVFNRDGKNIRCVYINNYRIVGAKPYVSENLPVHHYQLSQEDLASAGLALAKAKGGE